MEKRTTQQNKALHLFFRQLAAVINEAGLDLTEVLTPAVNVMATEENVKEVLWKPLQKVLLNTKSTTELLKQEEIDKVYDVLNKHFAENFLLTIPPFPSWENEDAKV